MSKINDGGPAFPKTYGVSNGMTLRDWFAGQALAATVSLIGLPEGDPDDLWNSSLAKQCYALADAMLAERERQP